MKSTNNSSRNADKRRAAWERKRGQFSLSPVLHRSLKEVCPIERTSEASHRMMRGEGPVPRRARNRASRQIVRSKYPNRDQRPGPGSAKLFRSDPLATTRTSGRSPEWMGTITHPGYEHASFERPVLVQLVRALYSFFGMVSHGGFGYFASTGATVEERTFPMLCVPE